MSQSLPRSLALIVLVILIAPAHAGDEKEKSPEDVFKSFAPAWKKGDVHAYMSHLTRDSQSFIAAFTSFAALIDKAFTGPFFGDRGLTPEEKAHIAAIDVVLKRHGVSEEAIQEIIKRDGKKPTTEEEKFLALGELVKDKPAFVTEMLKVSTASVEDSSSKEIQEAKVKEVKIDGQQAKGQVKFIGADGKEKTATVYFKTESEVWKIDLIETLRNWPPPPPQVKPAPQIQPQAPPTYSRPGPLRRLLNRLFRAKGCLELLLPRQRRSLPGRPSAG